MSAPLAIANDLAPGDFGCAVFDWEGFGIHRITSADDPKFDEAYEHLWAEFGSKNEVEQKDVLARRFDWRPQDRAGQFAMLYEMVLVEHEGAFAAVRDQTAIVPVDAASPRAVVHLSHVLVAPAWRGKGLAGWMRAWPIQTARACLLAMDRSDDAPITLVGEMEHAAADQPETTGRLRAYERAGFRKVDPRRVPYHQPDFRPATEIDRTGGPAPLPMALIVRRVKREHETSLTGAELRETVQALYHMYAREFREQDMRPLFDELKHYPGDAEPIALVPPTGDR